MRTKKALYNLISGIIPQIIVGILGVVKIRVFLGTLGADYNGLIQLFTQVFAYLSLTEGGIGAAIQFRLFKLLAENQFDEVNKILNGAVKYFKIIASVIVGIAIVLSFYINVFINNSPFSNEHVQLLFMIFAITNIIPFLFSTERILISSDQKNYITNLIFHSTNIAKSIIELYLLTKGIGIVNYLLISLLFIFVQWFAFKYLISILYPWFVRSSENINDEFKRDMKHLLPHRMISVVTSNTDIIVVSSFLGIFSASIYGIYNYVLGFLNQVITQISSALFSIIGNYVHSESIQNSKNLYNDYFFVVSIIANMIFVPLLFVFNGFVEVWAGSVFVVDRITLFYFLLIMHLTILLIPAGSFVSVKGYFKESKYSIMIEMVLNVSLSIIFVNIFGLKGVLLATVLARMPSSMIYIPFILYKNYFNESLIDFYVRMTKSAIITVLLYLSTDFLVQNVYFNMSTIYHWFFSGFVLFGYNLLILLVLKYILFNQEFMSFKERWRVISR